VEAFAPCVECARSIFDENLPLRCKYDRTAAPTSLLTMVIVMKVQSQLSLSHTHTHTHTHIHTHTTLGLSYSSCSENKHLFEIPPR